MNLKIKESTIKITTKCKKNFSCLSEERKDLCKVKHCVEKEVYFIECLNTEYCSYQKSFGNSNICTCPIRKEIYNTYKI